MTEQVSSHGFEIKAEAKKLKRELTLLPLFALIYFTVCGGAFGAEPMVGLSGPGLALLLFIITPIMFSIPNMLMVREMSSMMPVEGGYYHWVKQAFGPFAGFMAGWMNWVVSWVDVSIYPIWAAMYLGFFFPALDEGLTLGAVTIPAWMMQWLVALLLIWSMSYLSVRGARLAGLTAGWLGIVMITPLIIMTGVGVYNWIALGTNFTLTLLPGGQEANVPNLMTALSTGIFIAMWNFMGWELPTAAGDEIVNPKKTYPLAMTLVLVAAILTYSLPTIAGLYGGAGEEGRYLVWGQEVPGDETIGEYMVAEYGDYGITQEKMAAWNVDPDSDTGWEFPGIAQSIGAKASGGDFNSPLALFLGFTVTISAVLSMIGLFIGNSLGSTRIPFALAEDGMMPEWMVKVHPRFGTPWVAIIFCGIVYSIFSLQAFQFLVVVDVFLNMLVLLMELLALWVLRKKLPDLPRTKVPGGYFGLVLVTLGPLIFIVLAIVSQVFEEGLSALWLALAAMAVGALLYIPIKKYVKKGQPDVDPFRIDVS